MTDITIQLSNIIAFLMEKMDIKELEIPERILLNDGSSIVATKDPLKPNIKIRIGETK